MQIEYAQGGFDLTRLMTVKMKKQPPKTDDEESETLRFMTLKFYESGDLDGNKVLHNLIFTLLNYLNDLGFRL